MILPLSILGFAKSVQIPTHPIWYCFQKINPICCWVFVEYKKCIQVRAKLKTGRVSVGQLLTVCSSFYRWEIQTQQIIGRVLLNH